MQKRIYQWPLLLLKVDEPHHCLISTQEPIKVEMLEYVLNWNLIIISRVECLKQKKKKIIVKGGENKFRRWVVNYLWAF